MSEKKEKYSEELLHPDFRVSPREIIVLDKDPKKAAEALCDSDLVLKLGAYSTYIAGKAMMPNCYKWNRPMNNRWLWQHFLHCCGEANYRGLIVGKPILDLIEIANKHPPRSKDVCGTSRFSGVRVARPVKTWVNRFDANEVDLKVGNAGNWLFYNRLYYLLPLNWTKREPPKWYTNNLPLINKGPSKIGR